MSRRYADNAEAIKFLDQHFDWTHRLTRHETLERIWAAATPDLALIRAENPADYDRLEAAYATARAKIGVKAGSAA